MKKIKHEPYNAFKGKLREKGLLYKDVAATLDISEVAVSKKINGFSDFYVGETKKIFEVFGIETKIFFGDKVSN